MQQSSQQASQLPDDADPLEAALPAMAGDRPITPLELATRLSAACPFQVVRYADIKGEVPQDSTYAPEH
ncbi:hypothetical protein ACVALR_09830, partial [Stenotrophomonas maltophilia]